MFIGVHLEAKYLSKGCAFSQKSLTDMFPVSKGAINSIFYYDKRFLA